MGTPERRGIEEEEEGRNSDKNGVWFEWHGRDPSAAVVRQSQATTNKDDGVVYTVCIHAGGSELDVGL